MAYFNLKPVLGDFPYGKEKKPANSEQEKKTEVIMAEQKTVTKVVGNCPECGKPVTGLDFALIGKGETFDVRFRCPHCKEKRKRTFAAVDFGDEQALQVATLCEDELPQKPASAPVTGG